MSVSAVHFSLEEAAALSALPVAQVRDLLQSVVCDTGEAASYLPKSRPLSTAELFARMDLLLKVPENYSMRLDRATMATSVEARVPFQDLDLIGLVTQLSMEELLHGGIKGMLKQAFADVLPDKVRSRPKQTFQAPLLSWVRGPLEPWITAQISRLPASIRKALPVSDLSPLSTKAAYRTWCLGLLEGWRHTLGLEY